MKFLNALKIGNYMAKKKKYYVVWAGHNPGIYENWPSVQAEIANYSRAKYKSYPNLEEATKAFRNGWASEFKKKSGQSENTKTPYIPRSISVDAASSGNPGTVEYQGVLTHNKKQIFHAGPFEQGTNNLGEFLALVHALALLDKQEKYNIPIYSDSITAMSWVRNKKVKTTLERTERNKEIFQLVDRALVWIETHPVKNKILKWETRKWGEIPADFGRK